MESSLRSVAGETELPSPQSISEAENKLEFERTERAGYHPLFPLSLVVLVACGTLGLSKTLLYLSNVWTHDPLRSIGILIVAASLILSLRVWRQAGWEMQGTWWGLFPLALAFFLSLFSENVVLYWVDGSIFVNLIPSSLPLFLYASGVVLLLAGTRVWRLAWFPLLLLLFSQPMPGVGSRLVDLPLQALSAHVARSFASLIGFPPTSPQLLNLMFTPDFGMFIAPGCDGLRGAVTLGYVALITGYLKRVSIPRWISYVFGAVFLGYLFNLLRLCALVLYYRIAVGHHALEDVAKQVDYAIGGLIFLAATVLFLLIVNRKDVNDFATVDVSASQVQAGAERQQIYVWKVAAFAALALVVAVPGIHAIRDSRETMATSRRIGDLTPEQMAELMPRQIGDYTLSRTWQEQLDGAVAVENAAYQEPGSSDAILSVWLLPNLHNVHDSRLIRGESAEMRGSRNFLVAQGKSVPFDTAFYSDGITDSLVGNAFCTLSSCLPFYTHNEDGVHVRFLDPIDLATRGKRKVPIMFRIERLHTNVPATITHNALVEDAQRFLVSVDLTEISRRFQ
jgi:exosortase J